MFATKIGRGKNERSRPFLSGWQVLLWLGIMI